MEAVAQALLRSETIDGRLIHEAYKRSEAGEATEDIVEWLAGEASRELAAAEKEVTAPVVETPQAPKEEAPSIRPTPNLPPRPASDTGD